MASKPLAKTPTLLSIKKGGSYSHDGRTYAILHYAGLDSVIAREDASGAMVILNVGSLKAPFKGLEGFPSPESISTLKTYRRMTGKSRKADWTSLVLCSLSGGTGLRRTMSLWQPTQA